MNWRKIALYAFFLFMMVVFYKYQQIRLEKIKEKQEKAKQICKLKIEEVVDIKLKNENGVFEIKRLNEKWRLKMPIDDWADKFSVETILDNVIKAKVERTIKPVPEDLSPYGLDKPRIEINLMGKKRKFDLFLGHDTPDATKVYAITSEKKSIYLLPSSLVFTLNKKLDDLWDKHILEFDPVKIVKVSIKTKDKTILLEKQKDQWYLKAPFEAKADNDEVEDLLYRLQTERAKGFKDIKKIKPELEVSLSEKEKVHWLKLAMKENQILARSSYRTSTMIAYNDLWNQLTKTPETFKDRHFIKFDQESIKKVEIAFAQKKLTAKREKKTWLIEPKDLAEDYEIDFLLSDLLNLKYLPKRITTPKELPAVKAYVKLWDKKDKLIIFLQCFEDKECIWVQYNEKLYPVKKEFLESFPHKLKETSQEANKK